MSVWIVVSRELSVVMSIEGSSNTYSNDGPLLEILSRPLWELCYYSLSSPQARNIRRSGGLWLYVLADLASQAEEYHSRPSRTKQLVHSRMGSLEEVKRVQVAFPMIAKLRRRMNQQLVPRYGPASQDCHYPEYYYSAEEPSVCR